MGPTHWAPSCPFLASSELHHGVSDGQIADGLFLVWWRLFCVPFATVCHVCRRFADLQFKVQSLKRMSQSAPSRVELVGEPAEKPLRDEPRLGMTSVLVVHQLKSQRLLTVCIVQDASAISSALSQTGFSFVA